MYYSLTVISPLGCSTVKVTMSRLICNTRSPGFWIQLPRLLQLLRMLWLMGTTAIGGSAKVTESSHTVKMHAWRLSFVLTPLHPSSIQSTCVPLFICLVVTVDEIKKGTMFHAFSWRLLDLYNFYFSLSLMWTLIVLSKKPEWIFLLFSSTIQCSQTMSIMSFLSLRFQVFLSHFFSEGTSAASYTIILPLLSSSVPFFSSAFMFSLSF